MTDALDAADREIVRNRLEGIATEMGEALIRGAYSPNISERADCSTALFDPRGRKVAQAEHIPVHLGAMPEAVAAVIEQHPSPGDAYLLNDPYRGGTHLPDLTVVTPVSHADTILGYAVARAHHADVGGVRPGSLSADARSIYEEGLRIPPIKLATDGTLDESILDLVGANMRNAAHRRADITAQHGATVLADRRITELVDDHDRDWLATAFEAIIDYAHRRTTAALANLPNGTYSATDMIEGGDSFPDIDIQVSVELSDRSINFDFTGTDDQVDGPLNAPPPVTRSAVYYVVRCITDSDIPANHGCFAPIAVDIPTGSVLDPTPPAPVGAGNVETSQRVADICFEALRGAIPSLPARGQGTMNNLLIGSESQSATYYETIGGGMGGRAEADGLDGVQVGMTNTKNTPVEALERRYPILVETYALRPDTGGDGAHRGGLGLERALRVLAPATVSILADRRRIGPPGANGGEAGTTGENRIDGEIRPSKVTESVEADTIVRVLTPGGGGWGDPTERTPSARERDRTQEKSSE